MSYGYGIGDFIAVCKLVSEFQERFIEAPKRYKRLSDTLESLGHILEVINSLVERQCLTKPQTVELCTISRSCRNTLSDIDAVIQTFKILNSTGPRQASLWRNAQKAWKRLKWDSDKDQYYLARINTDLNILRQFQEKADRQYRDKDDILSWIGSLNGPLPLAALPKPAPLLLEKAGRWVLESIEFRSWMCGERTVLLCHGVPGAGKTTLMSIITRYLSGQTVDGLAVGIANIYCESGRHDDQTYCNLLASLLSQLARFGPRLPGSLLRLHEKHKRYQSVPLEDELSKELDIVVAGFSKVFILVDALDECRDDTRTYLLARLRNIQNRYPMNFLATSRHRNALPDFHQCAMLEIRARDEDVRDYLEANMQYLDLDPSFPDLGEKVKTVIIQAIDGMFLLGKIYFESLRKAKSPKELEKMLKELPTKSSALQEAYDNILRRIKDQRAEELAKSVLSIVAFAKRPLSTQEVLHALAVELGTNELDQYNFSSINKIIGACAGFLSVDEEGNMVRLDHGTMRQYLQQSDWLKSAEQELGKICIGYLSFDVFEAGPCHADECFDERLSKYPFYDYAARYWGQHVQKGSIEADDMVTSFLGSKRKVLACSQAMLVNRAHTWRGYSQRVPGDVSGLHLASYFGLSLAVKYLLAHEASVASTDTRLRTPLSWAAERGHEVTVNLLLKTGICIDHSDYQGRTALVWAALNGHRAIVELLLSAGILDLEKTRDGSGRTVLSWASGNGHAPVVQQLLDSGLVGVDLTDDFGRSPLSWAAESGHRDIVKLLIRTGRVQIDLRDGYGRAPFSRAAENGHNAILECLHAYEVDVDARDTDGRTPLSWAAENGHEAVVEFLLSIQGVNVLTTDRDGRTAFSWAAGSGQIATAQLLLTAAAVGQDQVLESPDDLGWTPLFWAAHNGHILVVDWLLKTGKVNIGSIDKHGGTALLWAARNGQEATVKLLLTAATRHLTSKDEDGRTPLSWAASEGYTTIVQHLLDADAVDVDAKDIYLRTPLSWAAENGKIDVVKMLLNIDRVNADSKDKDKRTPLSWAAENGHHSIADALLSSGHVDANSKDKTRRTPLSWAAEHGNEMVVRLLIGTGVVDIYSRDKKGRTPLMLAATDGYWKVVKEIIVAERGGIDISDRSGRTARSRAKDGGHELVLKFLRFGV